jgi:hypothetical protein
MVIHNWVEPRCTVASVVGRNVTLASPCGLLLYAQSSDGVIPAPVRIEASPPVAALKKGNFFHDADNNMLYISGDGLTEAELNTDSWIASEEVLIQYKEGTTGHSWENVHFQYSTWLQANTPDGYVDNQATTFHCTP